MENTKGEGIICDGNGFHTREKGFWDGEMG